MMIRHRVAAACCLGALALAGCKTMSYDFVVSKNSLGGGRAVVLPNPEIDLGYGTNELSISPEINQSGQAITVKDSCGADQNLSTVSILNGNATASVTSTSQTGSSVAVAINTGGATGEAATALARAQEAKSVGGGWDPERAARDCHLTRDVLIAKPGVAAAQVNATAQAAAPH